MNLYMEEFTHYAPKDSAYGNRKLFLAKNNEEAYKVVYPFDATYVEEALEEFDECLSADIGEMEAEDEKIRIQKLAIQEVVEAHGEMYMDEIELCDLYYGKTMSGWRLVQENVSAEDVEVLTRLKLIQEVK